MEKELKALKRAMYYVARAGDSESFDTLLKMYLDLLEPRKELSIKSRPYRSMAEDCF